MQGLFTESARSSESTFRIKSPFRRKNEPKHGATCCSPRKAPTDRERLRQKNVPVPAAGELPNALNIKVSNPFHISNATYLSDISIHSAAQRGGGLLVDCLRLCRQSSSGELRHLLNISAHSLRPPRRLHTAFKMAARIPISQVPAMFARRQPKVFSISKREFPEIRKRESSLQQKPALSGQMLQPDES